MFCVNVSNAATANNAYRRVLCTKPDFQLVVMNLQPRETIETEEHTDATQFLLVEEGTCTVTLFSKQNHAPKVCVLKKGDSVTIFQSHLHRVDAGLDGTRLMTIYTTPQHRADLVQDSQDAEE